MDYIFTFEFLFKCVHTFVNKTFIVMLTPFTKGDIQQIIKSACLVTWYVIGSIYDQGSKVDCHLMIVSNL